MPALLGDSVCDQGVFRDLLRAEWITKYTGRRARIDELTAAGKKQLLDEESRWHAVTSAANRVLRTV